MSLRSCLRSLLFLASFLLIGFAREARASVDIVLSFRALVQAASDVAVVTASDQRAVWEDGRIYTYSHLHVDEPVSGTLHAGDDVWVRTMGGVIDHIGQSVEGESVFVPGHSSLVFLHHSAAAAGSYVVTGRAQGQFPVVSNPAGVRTVIRSGAVGGLVTSPDPAAQVTPSNALDAPARDRLHGLELSKAHEIVATAWTLLHSAK